MKLRVGQVIVGKFKSGEREGEWRPFEVPDGATVVSVSFYGQRAIVNYVVKA